MRRTFVAGLAVPVLGMALYAHTQSCPDRLIEFLIPLDAGSAVDVVARLVDGEMGGIRGQRVFAGDLVRAANIGMG